MDEDIANFNDDDDIYRFGVAVNNRLGPKLMPGKKLVPRAFRSRNLGKLKFVKNHGFLFNQDVDDDNEPGRRVDKLFESFGF
jgi:hypothetical protein